MTHLSFIGRRGKFTINLVLICLLALLAASANTVWGQTFHNMPGTACAAYNNNQANALQRSHVRIYNPPSNTQAIWVICPMQRVVSDVEATSALPLIHVAAYFAAESSPIAEVQCIFREYDYITTHEPGGAQTGLINSINMTINRPAFLPGVNTSGYQSVDTDDITALNFYTTTCKLPPGTGINQITTSQR